MKHRDLCARVLAICPDGRIVVVQKPDGHVEFPGGGLLDLDLGDPKLTALRELNEETGISIEDTARLSLLMEYQKDANHTWFCYQLFLEDSELRWYRSESLEGKVVIICPHALAKSSELRMTERQNQILLDHTAILAS